MRRPVTTPAWCAVCRRTFPDIWALKAHQDDCLARPITEPRRPAA